MRTTLTLDPDVATAIARLQRERGVKFKPLVNELLRRGLGATGADPGAVTKPLDLGTPLVDFVSMRDVRDLLDEDQFL
jgi:hypothetical protein